MVVDNEIPQPQPQDFIETSNCEDSELTNDLLVIVQRNIQIGPDEDLLTLEVGGREVSYALLGHGGDAPGGFGTGPEGSELGSEVESEERICGGAGEAETAEWGGNEAGGRERGGGGGGEGEKRSEKEIDDAEEAIAVRSHREEDEGRA
ncbi:hypothetical protein U1Q18_051543, partial [Sarracenia purpurea var. burkii]